MTRILTVSCFFVFLFANIISVSTIHAQNGSIKPKAQLLKVVEKSIDECAKQYPYLMARLGEDRFPVTYYANNDKLVTSGSEPWVGGFYPGGLLYLYEHTRDAQLHQEALRKLRAMEKEQFNKTTHDLGFMMYCSFGNANRIDPKPEYNLVLINSARSLVSQ